MYSRLHVTAAAPRAAELELISDMLDMAEEIYGSPVLGADPHMFAFAGHLIDTAQARYESWLASESWKCDG